MKSPKLIPLLFLLSIPNLFAEPWLANRFAQNCAACHAPGRKNLPISDRRCTLSCQGCHVNPNGGGLRSQYGKWNENRWLASFRTSLFNNEEIPAPLAKQPYGNTTEPTPAKRTSKQKYKLVVPEAARPAVLATTEESEIDPDDYDRSDGLEKIIVSDPAEYALQIPAGDPQLQLLQNKIDGGADLRWINQRGTTETSSESGVGDGKTKLWKNFLMMTDVALRWRPVHKTFHLVYEGRYLGSPGNRKAENVAATLNRRSLYAMADNLPFNSYAMAGYYRPQFGSNPPDHTSLPQRLLSIAQQDTPSIYDLSYQAVSVGSSPNVPYANLHLISRQFGAKPNDSNQGLAFNLGGRFVTLGASLAYSYWSSKKEEVVATEKVTTRLQMHAINAGMSLWRWTTTLEAINIIKDRPNDAYHRGLVLTSENFVRVWREMYATVQYSQANMATDLKPGNSSQIRFGAKVFLFPGMDNQISYNYDRSEQTPGFDREGRDTKTNAIVWQSHWYL